MGISSLLSERKAPVNPKDAAKDAAKDAKKALEKQKLFAKYPWMNTPAWNFSKPELKKDMKICLHAKYGDPSNITLAEYSAELTQFEKFKNSQPKEEKKADKKQEAAEAGNPTTKAEKEAEIVAKVTSVVKTNQISFVKGQDMSKLSSEEQMKLNEIMKVLSNPAALSEELPEMEKSAVALDWNANNVLELQVSLTTINRQGAQPLHILRVNAIGEFAHMLEDMDNDNTLGNMIAEIYQKDGFFKDEIFQRLQEFSISDRDTNNDKVGNLAIIGLEIRGVGA